MTPTGQLVPRRRTRLQQKVHRHLCRQVRGATHWFTPQQYLSFPYPVIDNLHKRVQCILASWRNDAVLSGKAGHFVHACFAMILL